jgi:hypothetical protein
MVVASLAALAVGLTACVTEGVPGWAMHVRPAPVEAALDTNTVTARVTGELEQPELRQGHVSPEQIALVALQELRARRLADAGLWLAIATYRYHQEALLAAVSGQAGFKTLPPNVRVDVYTKLVIAEITQFGALEFFDELEVIQARLRGRDEVETAMQEQLTGLGKTDPIEREALRDVLAELRPNAGAAAEETRYPRLVEAFRRRLLDDFNRRGDDRSPAYHLASTPIGALQGAAVRAAVSHFEPSVCGGAALAFPAQRPTIIAALDHGRSEVRANAAATLGFAPSEETRPQLEARLAKETDARVKLALAFALIRHGVPEHVPALTAAVESCEPKSCALPAALIQWLPLSAREELEQAPFARIVADTRMTVRARYFAAAILRDIGHDEPLESASIEALIAAGRQKGDELRLPAMAIEAMEDAQSLTRETVLARLAERPRSAQTQDVLFPAPLLARLAKVSVAEDLPLLKRMMQRFGEAAGVEAHTLVEAALHIPGGPAADVLGNWYVRYTGLQTHIAFGLASRDGFPRDRLMRLVARGDARTQIVVKTVLQEPDARDTLLRYLINGSPQEQLEAASLAALSGQAGLDEPLHRLLGFRDARYYPNDALIRHAAMASLVRLALIASRPAPAKPRPPRDGSAPRSR